MENGIHLICFDESPAILQSREKKHRNQSTTYISTICKLITKKTKDASWFMPSYSLLQYGSQDDRRKRIQFDLATFQNGGCKVPNTSLASIILRSLEKYSHIYDIYFKQKWGIVKETLP